jgi:putative transposase
VIRSYRYRLRPTRAQERTLVQWLAVTRELYNAALQERRDAWRMAGRRVTLFDQQKAIHEMRQDRADVRAVPVRVLRGTLRRIDRAFRSYFRRCKAGEVPGYPRFKGASQWSSILSEDLAQQDPLLAGKRRLQVPLIGLIKVGIHRPLVGTPKALRLTRDGAGRWWATLACDDVPASPLPPTGREVGIDLGLHHFVATSDGEMVENPRPLAAARLALARAQRRVSKKKRGSARRRKAVRALARQHDHVRCIRREHHIHVARSLVARYDRIYVEDLDVKGLAASRLARSIHDAAWGGFLRWLRTKAESAGREVVAVDPRGTSQTCPACGAVEPKTLGERVHRCACGLVLDRDVAAAQVILGRGTRLRPGAAGCGTPLTRAVQVPTGDRITPTPVGA